jgi:hypothetical protein
MFETATSTAVPQQQGTAAADSGNNAATNSNSAGTTSGKARTAQDAVEVAYDNLKEVSHHSAIALLTVTLKL